MTTLQTPSAPTVLRAVARSRVRRRAAVITGLTLGVLAVACSSLATGEAALTAPEMLSVVLGGGDEFSRFVLVELRLPRLLMAALVGVAFALAGGLFQTVLRNPLASPDIIGVSQGASVGAVAGALVWGWTGLAVSGAALGGALLVAVVNLVIAWGGGLSGQRFVLCGIGLAFVATSVLSYLLTRSDVREAQSVLIWMAGSVSSADHDAVRRLGLLLLLLVPLALLVGRVLALLEMGDDTAASLGVRPRRARLLALALGVGLAAAATSMAGPVAFVALTAAPIARRLVADGRVAFVPTMLVGVLVVTLADFVAQHLIPGRSMPVGIVTGLIGGPYLLWLLATSPLTRRSR